MGNVSFNGELLFFSVFSFASKDVPLHLLHPFESKDFLTSQIQ